MKTKLVALSAALTLLASAAVCADRLSVRSSVDGDPDKSSVPPVNVSKTEPGNVRESAYARDLLGPTPHGPDSRWRRDAGFARLI